MTCSACTAVLQCLTCIFGQHKQRTRYAGRSPDVRVSVEHDARYDRAHAEALAARSLLTVPEAERLYKRCGARGLDPNVVLEIAEEQAVDLDTAILIAEAP